MLQQPRMHLPQEGAVQGEQELLGSCHHNSGGYWASPQRQVRREGTRSQWCVLRLCLQIIQQSSELSKVHFVADSRFYAKSLLVNSRHSYSWAAIQEAKCSWPDMQSVNLPAKGRSLHDEQSLKELLDPLVRWKASWTYDGIERGIFGNGEGIWCKSGHFEQLLHRWCRRWSSLPRLERDSGKPSKGVLLQRFHFHAADDDVGARHHPRNHRYSIQIWKRSIWKTARCSKPSAKERDWRTWAIQYAKVRIKQYVEDKGAGAVDDTVHRVVHDFEEEEASCSRILRSSVQEQQQSRRTSSGRRRSWRRKQSQWHANGRVWTIWSISFQEGSSVPIHQLSQRPLAGDWNGQLLWSQALLHGVTYKDQLYQPQNPKGHSSKTLEHQ